MLCLSVGLLVLTLASCSRTSNQTVKENAAEAVIQPTAPDDPAVAMVSEGDASTPKKHSRRDMEEAETELERERTENRLLKEENNWLRVQVLELQEALITANQNIYSLNRKLDAIFKPN
jgi:hypothetical protein